MKEIITVAALLATIGSGAALAQGTPPGYAPWQSSWPDYVKSLQANPMSAHTAVAARPNSRPALARNGVPIPVAGNTQGHSRGG